MIAKWSNMQMIAKWSNMQMIGTCRLGACDGGNSQVTANDGGNDSGNDGGNDSGNDGGIQKQGCYTFVF